MSFRIMHRFIGFAIVLFFGSFSMYSQPFGIGHKAISFVDASRSNRSIATEIYYPADLTGDDVPFTTASAEAFPVIAFGHGFVMSWDAYSNIWEMLVPNGYIVIFPKTEGGLSPSHSNFGQDLGFVINEMNALGAQQGGFFSSRIADANAVMGHSMGGGAAFLAAQFSSNIRSIVTLAAAETNPSAIGAAGNLNIPALVISGSNDCVTPPQTNQIAMYMALNSACKTYLEILGASHCQMANSNFFCNFGEATCTPGPTISRAEQHDVLETFVLLWLDAQLKLNCEAGSNFNTAITSDSRVTFQKNCEQCTPLDTKIVELNSSINLYPNPFSMVLTLANPMQENESS